MSQRIIAIGLDGFEPTIASELIAGGELPFLRQLLERSAIFRLDHGEARFTGLAWEHFSTGKTPGDYRRWSAVDFDPATYSIVQKATRHEPFTAALRRRVMAFDVPYHELTSQNVSGLANWGAHDPGVHQHSRPEQLAREIEDRFGPYPAKQFIYGYVWPDAVRTAQMGRTLDAALRLRSGIAQWLMAERLPDWELAIIVVSEFHSALEALWHGWDKSHPLNGLPSAAPAREGIVQLYRTLDTMLKDLSERFEDAALCLFSPHGMGPNKSDLPAMALVPELMFRDSFGKPFLREDPGVAAGRCAQPADPQSWSRSVLPLLGDAQRSALARRWTSLRGWVKRGSGGSAIAAAGSSEDLPLAWMPAAHYQPFWHTMRSFALPSFYDARIRVNLKGREASGIVPIGEYEKELDRIEDLMNELRDWRTGERIAARTIRPAAGGPMQADNSQCDLRIVFSEMNLGVSHPVHGMIGPLPVRRTGGHTGDFGLAAFANTQAAPGDQGVRSTFDFVPTLLHLLGEDRLAGDLSGKPLF